MRKRIFLIAAAVLACAVGIAAAGLGRGDPEPVAGMLSQRLDLMDKKPGVLERAEDSILKGDRYLLSFSGGQLQLYTYRTGDKAAQDLLNVNEDGFQIGGACVDWVDAPHFFLRDNVIVLYVGRDTAVLDMLERTCGPQIRGAPARL